MLRLLGSAPRRLRWMLQRWSASADRAFHDSLFAGQRYDPFSFAYPGYITIRRFADLASEKIGDARHVVDLGCGPAEITCEMARRRPDVQFTGVDHSEVAIARAREHAAALGLTNIRFAASDISTYAPSPPADIVMMFDAFHHLLDPPGFVRRCSADRFLLIEPAGDWLGGWQRTLDLDWIPNAFDTIRARLAWQLRAADGSSPGDTEPRATATAASHAGEPVEHRYTMDDFRAFFDGFGLSVRGTIAGLDAYPPDAYGRPPLRGEFGKMAYDALVAVEEVLVAENVDLHAKHWVIHAERGAPHALRSPRAMNPRDGEPPMHLDGAYDVEYSAYGGTNTAAAAATILPSITFRNAGWRTWSSTDPASPVLLSYHWLDADGAVLVTDGLRTPLPHALAPGGVCTMTCRIETPPRPGRYRLTIDLVDENVTWFSRAGARMLEVPFVVR